MSKSQSSRPALMERLWAKVERRGPDDCWLFSGALSKGYGWIGTGGRGGQSIHAHRAVLLSQGPPPFSGAQARHLCGVRACCNPAHLAWGDQSANEMDKVAHGVSNRGERHGMNKLRVEQVRSIRERCANGESQRAVARALGITQQTVSDIITRRTWGWLDAKGGDV